MTRAMEVFPQILTQTHNQTFNLSSTAILTCHVRDLGEHHVTWFKFDPLTSISSPLVVGRTLFSNDQRYSMSSYSTSARDSFWSLEIYQLNQSDEGTYLCQIANRRASVGVSIHLHIQIPMILHPPHVYTEPGRMIKLNCTIYVDENAKNHSTITWHFLPNQSANRTNHSRDVHIGKKNGTNLLTTYLIIEHAQMSHTGLWTCVYQRQRLSARVIVSKGNQRPCYSMIN